QHRRLGGHAAGVASLVPAGGGAALLLARLAEHPRAGQELGGGLPRRRGEGVARLSRTAAAQFRPAPAAAGRGGKPACPSGVGGPSGCRPAGAVRPGRVACGGGAKRAWPNTTPARAAVGTAALGFSC